MVQAQYPDKAAVDCSFPAFACAGSCTVVLCITLRLKGDESSGQTYLETSIEANVNTNAMEVCLET